MVGEGACKVAVSAAIAATPEPVVGHSIHSHSNITDRPARETMIMATATPVLTTARLGQLTIRWWWGEKLRS
jgi:hypothetical protein